MLEAGFYNMDCMDALKEYPDGYFDLAIVDPPYGDGNAGGGYNRFTPGGWFSRYKQREGEEDGERPRRRAAGRYMGDEIRKKNHWLGHGPGRGLFPGTVPGEQKSNHLGRELFHTPAYKVLFDLAEAEHYREFQYGHVRIRLDEL